MPELMTLPRRGRVRVRSVHKGAVRKVCRCEPVTDVTGVAAPRLDGNSLVLRPRCLKIRGIATPACALVRNDRAFSNSPIPCFTTTRLWAAAFFGLCLLFLFLRQLADHHRGENQHAAKLFGPRHGLVEQQPAEKGGEDGFQAHEQGGGAGGYPLLAHDL